MTISIRILFLGNYRFLFCVFAGLVIQPVVADCEYQKTYRRVALVIGNSLYQHIGELPNPGNDARDMTLVLKAYGFAVIERLNLNHDQAQETIDCFSKTLEHDGVGLFYYAGHGVQLGDRNYLLPTDINVFQNTSDNNSVLNRLNRVKNTSIEANKILGVMEQAGTRTNILILDACRNLPQSLTASSSEDTNHNPQIAPITIKGGLAPMYAPPGSFIAFATEPGNTSSDGASSNGLFTGKLLKYLKMPLLEITQVFNQTRAEVVNVSQRQQIPWTRSSMLGSFYFSPLVREVDKKQRSIEYSTRLAPEKQSPDSRGLTIIKPLHSYNDREFNKNFQRGKKYLYDKGRPNKAISYFTKALRFNPQSTDTLYQLGVANMEIKHYPQAIYNLKKAIEHSGSYFPAYEKLAESYTQIGDETNARFYRAKANEGVLLNYQEKR